MFVGENLVHEDKLHMDRERRSQYFVYILRI